MTAIVREKACFPEIAAWQPWLEGVRRDIHAHPELGFETAGTIERIVKELTGFGIPRENIDTETVKGAAFVLIEGNRPGATVALRADCDALPMSDGSANPWKSRIECRAHTCGHDGHTTWLLGALRYLFEKKDFPGRVLGIFQPAEEIGRGASTVVQAGILEKYGVSEIYGCHDEATLPKGVAGFCFGPAQASVDFFYITVKGKGTHGARPHLGVDPLPVASELVGTLQTIVSRKVNPVERAVVSICSINAGRFNAPNVVPGEATLSGTIRTFNPAVREQIAREMTRMVEFEPQASGCTGELRIDRLTGPVINHPDTTQHMMDFMVKQFGEDSVDAGFAPTMGGEDFAEYQGRVPGTIIRLGIADDAHAVSIHNPAFDFNDEMIAMGSTILAGTALARLAALERA